MRVTISGASGFVGQAVVRQLEASGTCAHVLLVDRAFARPQPFATLTGDLLDPDLRRAAIGECDVLLHLAALPGAAAASDPTMSRRVNVDLPLRLMEEMSGRRALFAGSIAVFGSAPFGPVDDRTTPQPSGVYATHKRMVELAVANAVDRGAMTGGVLRLPGIVARPPAAAGFGSAFLSDVFHAARARQPFRMPVAPDATSWICSARNCAANLAHAITTEFALTDALTLPSLTVAMSDLVAELGRRFGEMDVTWDEQPAIRQTFGSYPPLTTAHAQRLGFSGEASVAELVENASHDL